MSAPIDFKPHRPPTPKPVDPKGPEQLTMPPGKLNFGTIVFGIAIVAALLVTLLAVIASK